MDEYFLNGSRETLAFFFFFFVRLDDSATCLRCFQFHILHMFLFSKLHLHVTHVEIFPFTSLRLNFTAFSVCGIAPEWLIGWFCGPSPMLPEVNLQVMGSQIWLIMSDEWFCCHFHIWLDLIHQLYSSLQKQFFLTVSISMLGMLTICSVPYTQTTFGVTRLLQQGLGESVPFF